MSDTEREAFDQWRAEAFGDRMTNGRDVALMFEAFKAGRRTTTTEARAPLLQKALEKWDSSNKELQAICDDLGALAARAPAPHSDVRALRSALERVTYNYRLTLAGKPVRDVSETLAECDAALAGPPAPSVPSDEKGSS